MLKGPDISSGPLLCSGSVPSATNPKGPGNSIVHTLTHQNLLFCRVPMNSILGFIVRTSKKVGFGGLRY